MKKIIFVLLSTILLASCVKVYYPDYPECPKPDDRNKVEVAFTFDGDILQTPITRATLATTPAPVNIHWMVYDGTTMIAEGDYVNGSSDALTLTVAPGDYKFKFVAVDTWATTMTIGDSTNQHLYAATKHLTIGNTKVSSDVTLTRVMSAIRVAQHKGNSKNLTIQSVTLESKNTLNLVTLDKAIPKYDLTNPVVNTAAVFNTAKYDPTDLSLTPNINYVFPGQTVTVIATFIGPSGKTGTVTREIVIVANTIYTLGVWFNTQDGHNATFEITVDPSWNPEQVIN